MYIQRHIKKLTFASKTSINHPSQVWKFLQVSGWEQKCSAVDSAVWTVCLNHIAFGIIRESFLGQRVNVLMCAPQIPLLGNINKSTSRVETHSCQLISSAYSVITCSKCCICKKHTNASCMNVISVTCPVASSLQSSSLDCEGIITHISTFVY